MIRPALALRTKAVTARSISLASRTSIGVSSTPKEGATAWMAPNCPLPDACLGSRSTATRARPGAISLSSSNHFTLTLYSAKSRSVAARPCQALDEAATDRVPDVHEYDRHGPGRFQQIGQTRAPGC